jgi:uncharacterized delta-60 repeat protein
MFHRISFNRLQVRISLVARFGLLIGLLLSLILGLAVSPLNKSLAAAGDLDPTFGVDGIVLTDIIAAHNIANDMAIQPDGKIVVVGQSYRLRGFASRFWTICRYSNDGSLDTTFGHDGSIATLFPKGNGGNPFGVAIQPDGKIVVAGLSEFAFGSMVVTRYETDGVLDKTFDDDGIAVVTFEGLLVGVEDIEIQTDGKIVLAGGGGADLGGGAVLSNFAVARLNTDGSPDLSFGDAGKLITEFGAASNAHDLAIQPDGKIVVSGEVQVPFIGPGFPTDFSDLALARYNADGSLDTSFNGSGKVITDVSDSTNYGNAVAVQSDGKIIVAGLVSLNPGENAELLARYDSNGLLDASFDSDGVTITPGGFAADSAIQPDGKIVVGRFSHDDFSTSRHNTDGSLDTSFGIDGVVITHFSNTTLSEASRICCTAIQADGRIVVAGFSDRRTPSKGDFALARYLGD